MQLDQIDKICPTRSSNLQHWHLASMEPGSRDIGREICPASALIHGRRKTLHTLIFCENSILILECSLVFRRENEKSVQCSVGYFSARLLSNFSLKTTLNVSHKARPVHPLDIRRSPNSASTSDDP